MEQSRVDRFAEAYLEMAKTARYRPEAPSDGLGGIQLSSDELHNDEILQEEASRYAQRILKQDDDGKFDIIGCTDFDKNKLFVYLLSAAGLCCGGDSSNPILKRLIEISLHEIKSLGA